jgi:hypothetical protein
MGSTVVAMLWANGVFKGKTRSESLVRQYNVSSSAFSVLAIIHTQGRSAHQLS